MLSFLLFDFIIHWITRRNLTESNYIDRLYQLTSNGGSFFLKFYNLLSSVHSVESLIDVLVAIDDFLLLIIDNFFYYDLNVFFYGIDFFAERFFLHANFFAIDLTFALLMYLFALVI